MQLPTLHSRRVCVRALTLGAVSLAIPAMLSAQPPAKRAGLGSDGSVRTCNLMSRAATVRIVDAATGEAIRGPDAKVSLTRPATGERLGEIEELPVMPGRWVVLTNTTLHGLRADGEVLLLEIARPGRTLIRHELGVSLDHTGCYPVLADTLVEIKG